MQGRKILQTRLLYQVSLDDLVPKDNYYRQLSQVLDLQWLYKATARFYGREGNESIEPIVLPRFDMRCTNMSNRLNSSDNPCVRDRSGMPPV
jgi:hypothetical protein